MHPRLTGAYTCARYAYAPNYYHYCGPDTEGELQGYLEEQLSDPGLTRHLSEFEVMYPYLRAIAEANGIGNPLDPRVVEAYWVGSSMLEKVDEQQTYMALMSKQRLPERIPKNELKWLLPKIDKRARLHHSFHVFNVFTRTGHHSVQHTVETMDQCRVSWGQLMKPKIRSQKVKVQIQSQKLRYLDGELQFEPVVREVMLPVDEWVNTLKPGDWVSVHWGFVCDRLDEQQVRRLKRYTDYHLRLANETI